MVIKVIKYYANNYGSCFAKYIDRRDLMKNILKVIIVIAVTFITMTAMILIEPDITRPTSNPIEQGSEDLKLEGTGYIFDDFGKNINIEIPDDNEKKESNKNTTKRSIAYQKYMALHREMREPPPPYIEFDIPIHTEPSKDNYTIEQAAQKVSFKDKVYILKLAKYLDINELSIIKEAINQGTNEENSKLILNILKEKLSSSEYSKLLEIINKYEQ